jgi:xyloglucan:xyloglucosyl transferase
MGFTGIRRVVLLASVVAAFLAVVAHAAYFPVGFNKNYASTTNAEHTQVLNGGEVVNLVLDQSSAAAFGSKGLYLFGAIGMNIKLVPGNSAGTVTAYYLSSGGDHHDELDFEFLGNVSGQPYALQTNVFAQGVGGREQRISLWFDPTAEFHSYSVRWTREIIIFFVDDTPIRVFRNNEILGVPFPNAQPMGIYASLWDGSSWATQGGKYPVNWAAAPFVASFKGFGVDGCEAVGGNIATCAAGPVYAWWNAQRYQYLTAQQIDALKYVQSTYLHYDYCADRVRYPIEPFECVKNWYGS